mgnify:CR=1 FL=1
MKGFEVYEYDIDENKKIIIINIEEISTELEEEINRYITEIWEGYTDGDISDVKKEILRRNRRRKESRSYCRILYSSILKNK